MPTTKSFTDPTKYALMFFNEYRQLGVIDLTTRKIDTVFVLRDKITNDHSFLRIWIDNNNLNIESLGANYDVSTYMGTRYETAIGPGNTTEYDGQNIVVGTGDLRLIPVQGGKTVTYDLRTSEQNALVLYNYSKRIIYFLHKVPPTVQYSDTETVIIF